MLNHNLELCMINGCKSNKIIKIIITNKIINNNEKIENFYFYNY